MVGVGSSRGKVREAMRLMTLSLVTLVALSLVVTAAPGASSDDAASVVAVPRQTAERLGLRVGDVIEVSANASMQPWRRVRVAAIWDAPEHPADVARGDMRLRFHLPTLESLLGRTDQVDRVVIRLQGASTPGSGGPKVDDQEARRVRDDLRALGAGFDVYTAGELVTHTSRTFVVVSRFHRAIALVTVLASGIFLVAIMALKLTEMRREIGALRLIGIGQATVGLTILMVAAAVAIAGAAVGAGLGAALTWGINAYYQPLFGTSLRFAVITPATLVFAGGVATALGLAAGALVAARLLRQGPLEQVGR